MKAYEEVDLLRGLLAIAVADGVITGSERGLYERLARKAGVGQLSLEAMVDLFKRDPDAWKNERMGLFSEPQRAIELFAAAAQIDGQISPREKDVLFGLAKKLGVTREQFAQAAQRGIRSADAARSKRGA